MERPRSLPRSFSLKPTRFLLLSSTISSSLLFCIYFSFWLLDSTPSGDSAAYSQLVGGAKSIKAHPFAVPKSSLVVGDSRNPPLGSLDVGQEQKDEIFGEAVDSSSIDELDYLEIRANADDLLFINATASQVNSSTVEEQNGTGFSDEVLDAEDVSIGGVNSSTVEEQNGTGFSDEVLDAEDVSIGGENSEFDAGDVEKGEAEDDIMPGNSSLDQGKVSRVDPTETEGTSTCDVSDGRWIFDESYPLYPANSCPFVDEGFSCEANGRMDKDYMKWRWQPNGCIIPRFNPVKMLELIRGKRLVFVGDSINRNQWESMLCMLQTALSDRSRVYEARGQRITKNRGYYNFKFPDYSCSVEYYVTHHLVREGKARIGQRRVSTLRIDTVDRSSSRWRGADVLVFNSAHWWSHHKTKAGVNYYQEGNRVHPRLDVSTAFRKALSTWALWVDQHVIPGKTQVFFRSSEPSHFSGGEWNSGGHCKESIHPLNDSYARQVPERNIILEQVVKQMKTPVTILNITNLSGLRIDGHPSVYGKSPGRGPPTTIQDCSHWCLPGVPDTWNELLYFHLLSRHKPAIAS